MHEMTGVSLSVVLASDLPSPKACVYLGQPGVEEHEDPPGSHPPAFQMTFSNCQRDA